MANESKSKDKRLLILFNIIGVVVLSLLFLMAFTLIWCKGLKVVIANHEEILLVAIICITAIVITSIICFAICFVFGYNKENKECDAETKELLKSVTNTFSQPNIKIHFCCKDCSINKKK